MLHSGTRMTGGNLPAELDGEVHKLLDEFVAILAAEVKIKKLRRAIVRAMLPCNVTAILDMAMLWVIGQKSYGMPATSMLDYQKDVFPIEEIQTAAKWEFGYEDPFVIPFAVTLLNQSADERKLALLAIARSHIELEVLRVNAQMNTIQINPLFGPAHYQLDTRLAFVLMPFTTELTEIYQNSVKPTVENAALNLVCRRADDIKSNKAIIQDIWKSICEARIIIADMTDLNPNVMYELGIAHTLGKETILLYQKNEIQIKFPFDLSHIRRIEYENTMAGAVALGKELTLTLQNVLGVRLNQSN